jgi:DNA-binding NtrC family response regulator
MAASSIPPVQIGVESAGCCIIGSSPVMQRIAQLVQQIGPTDAPVLISGASGTGKGLVARTLHLSSQRRDRPLVTVRCAGVEESLLENELFGREAAATTGTRQNGCGLMEVAKGGNVRELANVLERAQMLASDDPITLDDLPQGIVQAMSASASKSTSPRHLREVERRHVLEVLQGEKWNKLRAANALGISRRALYRLIEKYRLGENISGGCLEPHKTAV